MDTALALLLNIVYGFLFFVAFGVLIATTGVFAVAFWDVVGRRWFGRKAKDELPKRS
jgi:hypothetical protein